jgi:hypothetical protein
MPEMETTPHEEHYYEAAQAAHEEFFVSTNKLVDEAFQAFEKAYQAFKRKNYNTFNDRIKVDLTGMTSRSRILLIRQIIQKLANNLNNLVSIL